MAVIQYYGTGRRKSSTARVFLRPGTGQITINHKAIADAVNTESAMGFALIVIWPLPGRRNTRAVEDLRRPVP